MDDEIDNTELRFGPRHCRPCEDRYYQSNNRFQTCVEHADLMARLRKASPNRVIIFDQATRRLYFRLADQMAPDQVRNPAEGTKDASILQPPGDLDPTGEWFSRPPVPLVEGLEKGLFTSEQARRLLGMREKLVDEAIEQGTSLLRHRSGSSSAIPKSSILIATVLPEGCSECNGIENPRCPYCFGPVGVRVSSDACICPPPINDQE